MKKLMVIVAAFAFASLAQASELWWTVNTSGFDADTAVLYYSTNGQNFDGTRVDSWSISDIADYGNAYSSIDDVPSSATSFYIELYKSSEWVASSYTSLMDGKGIGAVAIDDLKGSIWTDGMSKPTAYNYSSFSANIVPEPTSGLMILLGLAALGLKRKRA